MKKALLFLICMTYAYCSMSQVSTDTIAKATEFSIPTSGAFTLLGNNPANVSTPGFTKDIKLDYFLDEFSLKPNIAFEFQPVWLFGFKNVSLDAYQKKSYLIRLLSTANVSLGTFTKDEVSKLAYSLKFSFIKDPMVDRAYLDSINQILDKSRITRENENILKVQRSKLLSNQVKELKSTVGILKKQITDAEQKLTELNADPVKYDLQIKQLNILLMTNVSDTLKYNLAIQSNLKEIETIQSTFNSTDAGYDEALNKEVLAYAKSYKEKNWYKPKLDIGAGKVNTYKNASLTQLGLKNNGFGIWANPSFGFIAGSTKDAAKAAKILITGLFKYIESDGAGQEFYGGNIRYGSSTLNLFAEYTYLKDGAEKTNSLAYGGAYTIGSKKLIEFGIRTDYTKDFDFKSLVPVIAFNWKLGKDLLK